VDFTMHVGAVSQEVVVRAESSRVDTTTSSLGHIVDNTQINELPLNGRNFIDLTLLQTGITQFPASWECRPPQLPVPISAQHRSPSARKPHKHQSGL